MVGFYCVTQFQMLLSVLLKAFCFRGQEAALFIVSPLRAADYDVQALRNLGFSEVFEVDRADSKAGRECVYSTVFFYSIYCAYPDYLKSLRKEKLALAYEGVTSFQLKHWHNGRFHTQFDLEADIDEIWLPDMDLLLDKEFLPKCRRFSFALRDDEEWNRICDGLNVLFGYAYAPVKDSVIFMDRYLSQYVDCMLNLGAEKFLTQMVVYGMGGTMAVKRHPYDANYHRKYAGLANVSVLSENVPWELVYLNGVLRDKEFHVSRYVIYNSFAPANVALLFGDTSFECVCVEPLLDKYSDIRDSYLNSDITTEILENFSKKYGVGISYVRSLAELWKTGRGIATEDGLWETAEAETRKVGFCNVLEFKAFRLELDSVLVSLGLRSGRYWLNADNFSANVSRQLLRIALPFFSETESREKADCIIDCDGSLADYSEQDFDVRQIRVIEGCARLDREQAGFAGKLYGKENLYIWGASPSNQRTLDILEKTGLSRRLKKVFDTYAKGECRGVPIVPFSCEEVKENRMIIVCANIAYPEITQTLSRLGYKQDIDFTLGLGIGESDKE